MSEERTETEEPKKLREPRNAAFVIADVHEIVSEFNLSSATPKEHERLVRMTEAYLDEMHDAIAEKLTKLEPRSKRAPSDASCRLVVMGALQGLSDLFLGHANSYNRFMKVPQQVLEAASLYLAYAAELSDKSVYHLNGFDTLYNVETLATVANAQTRIMVQRRSMPKRAVG